MRNLLVVLHGYHVRLLAAVAQEVAVGTQLGVAGVAMTTNALRDLGTEPAATRMRFKDYVGAASSPAAIERDLGGLPLNRALAMDRVLRQMRAETQAMRAGVVHAAWTAILNDVAPELVILPEVASFSDVCLVRLARARSIQTLILQRTPFVEPRIAFSDDITAQWLGLRDAYERDVRALDAAAPGDGLTVGAPTRPTASGVITRDLRRVPRLAAKVIDRVADRGTNYIEYSPLDAFVKFRLRRLWGHAGLRVESPFMPFEPESKYVVFPIHVQPEASTLVRGTDYVDQLATATALARELPAGILLAVKEHPAALGLRPRGYYAALQKIPGVRLVGPDQPKSPLIEASIGVVTIGGTMGFEAIVARKPVWVLGHTFYEWAPGARRLSDPRLLGGEAARPHAGASADDVDRLLAAIASASTVGRVGDPIFDPRVTSKSNIESIAMGLRRWIAS